MTTTWTKDKISRLKKMWEEGKTANQIAQEFGNLTRNAVIGKLYRLGLSSQSTADEDVMRVAQEKRKRSQPSSKGATKEATKGARRKRKKRKGLKILELTDKTCRWPIGDPNKEDFYFCGDPPKEGLPYCSEHCAQAYQPSYLKKLQKKKSA